MLNLTPQEKTVFIFLAVVLLTGSAWEAVSKEHLRFRHFVSVLDGPALYRKIDINTASKEDLVSVPYIGDYTAEKIIEYRDIHKFSDVNELKMVKGIKGKNFEKFKLYLTVGR